MEKEQLVSLVTKAQEGDTDLIRYGNGQKRIIYENIGTLTYDEYTSQYNEKILNYH